MTDRGPLYDQNDTPEDVATLYSWANLHGAKYRDFSEARAQTRERARLRVQQAIEEEQTRAHQQALTDHAVEAQPAPEPAQTEGEKSAEAVAQEVLRQAELRARERVQETAAQELGGYAPQRPEEPAQNNLPASQQRPLADRFAAFVAASSERPRPESPEPPRLSPQQIPQERPSYTADAPQRLISTALPVAPQLQEPPMREENPMTPRGPWGQNDSHENSTRPDRPAQERVESTPPVASRPPQEAVVRENPVPPRGPWSPVDSRESATRPAWLTPERTEPGQQPPTPRPTTDDTLLGSRERLASRWYALRGVFEGPAAAQPETTPAAPPARAPVVAVFSLAGGVGKTSLVATLARALSARGERILVVDTAAYGLLPFFFGAHDQRPGVLRTFSPPGTSGDAPIQMVAVDPESMDSESDTPDAMVTEIGKYSRGISRVIVDLATASGATSRRVMKMAPIVLVPMIPDMNSVVSVSSIDSFFQHKLNGNSLAKPSLPFYVLNQFDPSLPLHLDIREVLREQLGERLLPFVLRRNPAMSEALAEGMTVMDYAPNSTVAEDFGSLAGWVKSQSAPASSTYRGVRWSER